MVTFDARHPGTSTRDWAVDPRLTDRPELSLDGVSELLVVAAHPDDETLGAGGLIAECARRGIPVQIVMVTDGAARRDLDPGIAGRRSAEFAAAVQLLAPRARIHELDFPDGATRENQDSIREALARLVHHTAADALVAAPWQGDGHRDHRIVGEIVSELAGQRRRLEYPVWMWHWADPSHPSVPWDDVVSLPIDASLKARALASYPSQTEGEQPMLSPEFLEHFQRDREYYFMPSESSDALSPNYFDALYERREDPWGFETRWYEERKRAITLAALPDREYATALELGCSIGVLTESLAERCRQLLAVDVSQAAVDRARERLGDRALVARADLLTDFPVGQFDLIVLSEVGYYFEPAQLDSVLDAIEGALTPDGTLVACHWRHPVTDYPIDGDLVHARLRKRWPVIVEHVEQDFVLEVFSTNTNSVARREGLL